MFDARLDVALESLQSSDGAKAAYGSTAPRIATLAAGCGLLGAEAVNGPRLVAQATLVPLRAAGAS